MNRNKKRGFLWGVLAAFGAILLVSSIHAEAATVGGAVRNDGFHVALTDVEDPVNCPLPGTFVAEVFYLDVKGDKVACWVPTRDTVIILDRDKPVLEIPMENIMDADEYAATIQMFGINAL